MTAARIFYVFWIVSPESFDADAVKTNTGVFEHVEEDETVMAGMMALFIFEFSQKVPEIEIGSRNSRWPANGRQLANAPGMAR